MTSLWTSTVSLPEHPPLDGDCRTDIAVIGGGLTGVLTAWLLRREGAGTLLLESDRVGGGQTAGTTAKLTAQHGLRYHRLTEALGRDTAQKYAKSQLEAVEWLRQLVKTEGIACDFRDCAACLYATGDPAPLDAEYNACRDLGMEVYRAGDSELPFPAQVLGLRRQARFHPLKLVEHLARDLDIREGTRVLDVDGGRVLTDHGTVTAQQVVFACHYPFLNVPGFFFARMHQERSYVLALEGATELADCYLGVDPGGLSLRSWGRFLLLGGGSHRTGDNQEGGKYNSLRQAAHQFWPGCREVTTWSAQDCVPMDGMPFIGRYTEHRPEWLVATGFQKWGMTAAVTAARTLAALALGRTPPEGTDIFSPSRFHVAASAGQLAEDAAFSILGLSRRVLEPGRVDAEALSPGHGGVAELGGKKVGAYRDEGGTLHTVPLKCPHMGCQLEWNPDEKSWDCPCHGSRFDCRGRLLDGPAQTDLR